MKTPEEWLEIRNQRGAQTQPAGTLRFIRQIQEDARRGMVAYDDPVVSQPSLALRYVLGIRLPLGDTVSDFLLATEEERWRIVHTALANYEAGQKDAP